MKLRFLTLLLIGVCFTACEEPVYMPKPRTYPRIMFPAREYQNLEQVYCPFQFEFPTYCVYEKDEKYFDAAPLHECWFDLVYPDMNGRIHFSYYPLSDKKNLTELTNDSYDLIYKHTVKADAIPDYDFNNKMGVSGVIFELEGQVASPFQFFVTDSVHHFLRGALYFNSTPEPDSMKPVIEFVKTDIVHLLNTMRWVD